MASDSCTATDGITEAYQNGVGDQLHDPEKDIDHENVNVNAAELNGNSEKASYGSDVTANDDSSVKEANENSTGHVEENGSATSKVVKLHSIKLFRSVHFLLILKLIMCAPFEGRERCK